MHVRARLVHEPVLGGASPRPGPAEPPQRAPAMRPQLVHGVLVGGGGGVIHSCPRTHPDLPKRGRPSNTPGGPRDADRGFKSAFPTTKSIEVPTAAGGCPSR